MTSVDDHLSHAIAAIFPVCFRAKFADMLVLNFWLAEFLLSAIINRFEFRYQSTGTDAIVLPNLSLLIMIVDGSMDFAVD